MYFYLRLLYCSHLVIMYFRILRLIIYIPEGDGGTEADYGRGLVCGSGECCIHRQSVILPEHRVPKKGLGFPRLSAANIGFPRCLSYALGWSVEFPTQ